MTKTLRTSLVAASAAFVIAAGFAALIHAQAPAPPAGTGPSFEVASVKPNKSGDMRVMFGMQPGGRFTATNAPLVALIRQAYQIQNFQLVGAPDWINDERFDIVAKAEGDVPPQPPGTVGPMQLMMRNLLAERFKLVVHPETREMAIYALVLARSDGKLGENLKPAATDCAALMRERGRGGPPLAPPPPGERMQCGMRIAPGAMNGGGFPLSQLATTLSQFVQRVVVDRTGLTGNYDLELKWTPDRNMPGAPIGPPPPGVPPLPPIDPDGPSIFTAVQEQLGLKLDPQRGPVDVLVVDSVERPSPD
jgi:uncharacterized protein (TIGR03435 family)